MEANQDRVKTHIAKETYGSLTGYVFIIFIFLLYKFFTNPIFDTKYLILLSILLLFLGWRIQSAKSAQKISTIASLLFLLYMPFLLYLLFFKGFYGLYNDFSEGILMILFRVLIVLLSLVGLRQVTIGEKFIQKK